MRNVNRLPPKPLTVKARKIEETDMFRYLGSLVSTDGSPEHEIVTCITYAGSAIDMLRNVWRSATFCLKLILSLFNSNVLSVLTYGSKSWALTKQLEERIQSFENNCLRRFLRIYWRDEIREKTKQPLVIDKLISSQCRYWGLMVRMGSNRRPHDVHNASVMPVQKRKIN